MYDVTSIVPSGRLNSSLVELNTQSQTRWRCIGNHITVDKRLHLEWIPRKRLTLQRLVDTSKPLTFDLEGTVLFVGAITKGNDWKQEQWVFVSDQTFDAKRPLMLAIKLSAPIGSIDLLDSDAWQGCICLFKDLEFVERDVTKKFLVASATELSSHERVSNQKLHLRNKDLGTRAENSEAILDEWADKIKIFVNSR